MSEASKTDLKALGGVGLQGTTLGTLVLVFFMGRGAFEDAIGASERAVTEVTQLRIDIGGIRAELAASALRYELASSAFEASEAITRERALRIDLELEAMRRCLREPKRKCDL